jgi:ElaB/YqjD/DUF883 family membrane-anchored ribosome-binding protein
MKPKNFSQAIDELEDLTRDKGGDMRERLEAEIKRLQDTLENMKPHLEEAKKAKTRVEKEIQENPWAAIGIVGLVLFVIGFLLGTRRSD